ncbi:MAG: hypothetical protein WEB03_10825 [Nitriliruptor sp.]|uniref:membrane protein YczE n=1 Tax=Nitriliruptor sp. TaxID=2448056 RepID=UPI00349FF6F1
MTFRIARLLGGLTLCGWGIASMVAADLGLGPWDVLHEGVATRTGIGIGAVSIGVGALVLLAWFPLRERPGPGTIANVIVIGVVIDLTLLVLDTPSSLAARLALCAAGPILFGVGSGFYLGSHFGSGPRDGLMTGLARRGISVAVARTGIEVTALAIGWMLGGTVGLGTVLFAVSIGPLVQLSLRWLTVPVDEVEGVRSAR